MSLRLVFLGSGTSAGVPMIGCHCEVCRSDDPRDRRSRASVMVSYSGGGADETLGAEGESAGAGDGPTRGEIVSERMTRQFLIDTTPELRVQCLREGIDRIDGVFYTHAHADHIFGLDDLRRFNAVMQQPIDIFADDGVLARFREMFSYIFEPHRNVNKSFIANLTPRLVAPGEPIDLFGARWTPLELMHGRLPILGFRVDLRAGSSPSPDGLTAGAGDGPAHRSLAYCTDVSGIPPQTYPLLADLDVLVIDALRYRHHPTHFTVDQALEQIEQIKPKRAYLTHIAHEVCHADLSARLPEGVELAYDGLAVDVI